MRAFTRGRPGRAVVTSSLYAMAVLLWPGFAAALVPLPDQCPQNPKIISELNICVVPVERPAGGCDPCVPFAGPPASDRCPSSRTVGPPTICCSNLSEAVFIAERGDTIGVFSPTQEPAVAGVDDVGPNVTITAAFGSPFNSNRNLSPVNAGLRIEECHNAKIFAGTPLLPVIDIKPGAGNIIINGIDVIGGSVGILAENSGTPAQPGAVIKAVRASQNSAPDEPVNLTALFNAQLVLNVSSSFPGFPPTFGVDDNLNTSWFTAIGNACNLGNCPFFEIVFPQDVTVDQLQMFGNRGVDAVDFDFLAGRFQLFSAGGLGLFDSGVVNLPAPDRDVVVPVASVAGVRRVRFTATSDESPDPGFAELKVFGPTGSGAGIEVRGNGNEVSGNTATANDIGFLVSGNSNLLRSNKGNGNTGDGFTVTGNSNDVRGNEANSNGGQGFDVSGTNNQLRSNQANRSPQGGPKENGSCEYSFANSTTQDFGGNKMDNVNFVGTIAGSPKRFAAGCYGE